MFELEHVLNERDIVCDVNSESTFAKFEHTECAFQPLASNIHYYNPLSSLFNGRYTVMNETESFYTISPAGNVQEYDISENLYNLELQDPLAPCYTDVEQSSCIFSILIDQRLWCILELTHGCCSGDYAYCSHFVVVAFNNGTRIFTEPIRGVFDYFKVYFLDYPSRTLYVFQPSMNAFIEIDTRTLKVSTSTVRLDSTIPYVSLIGISMDRHKQIWILSKHASESQSSLAESAHNDFHAISVYNLRNELLAQYICPVPLGCDLLDGLHHPMRNEYYVRTISHQLLVFKTCKYTWRLNDYQTSDEVNKNIILYFECFNRFVLKSVLPTELREIIYCFLPIYATK